MMLIVAVQKERIYEKKKKQRLKTRKTQLNKKDRKIFDEICYCTSILHYKWAFIQTLFLKLMLPIRGKTSRSDQSHFVRNLMNADEYRTIFDTTSALSLTYGDWA